MAYNPYLKKQSAELGLDYTSDEDKLQQGEDAQTNNIKRDQALQLLKQLQVQTEGETLKNRLANPLEKAKMDSMVRDFETRKNVSAKGDGVFSDTKAPPLPSVPFSAANFKPVASHGNTELPTRNIQRVSATLPDVNPAIPTRAIQRIGTSSQFTDPDAAASDRARAELNPAVMAAQARADSGADNLVKVEHKDPATGRTVMEWLPKSSLKDKTFQKGEGATTENRLASAQAVNQTGEDMIAKLSDPAYASQVGVAMGRANTLRDFIGNPPPEFADLAGMIESYSLANMGVHGMRSAQGAEQIKHLLDQKHTPKSLIATIRGLNQFSNHFMQNAGRGADLPSDMPAASGAASGTIAMVAPDGRPLTVPAEKVAELEKAGAKRK